MLISRRSKLAIYSMPQPLTAVSRWGKVLSLMGQMKLLHQDALERLVTKERTSATNRSGSMGWDKKPSKPALEAAALENSRLQAAIPMTGICLLASGCCDRMDWRSFSPIMSGRRILDAMTFGENRVSWDNASSPEGTSTTSAPAFLSTKESSSATSGSFSTSKTCIPVSSVDKTEDLWCYLNV